MEGLGAVTVVVSVIEEPRLVNFDAGFEPVITSTEPGISVLRCFDKAKVAIFASAFTEETTGVSPDMPKFMVFRRFVCCERARDIDISRLA